MSGSRRAANDQDCVKRCHTVQADSCRLGRTERFARPDYWVSYVDPSGIDAADVAITTSFGTTWWKNLTVVSDEVAAGKPAVG